MSASRVALGASLSLIRTRIAYLLVASVVMLLCLASRHYREQLPAFVGDYSGDTLWALMLYLLVSVLLAGHQPATRAVTSLIIAFLVEFSQLYHAPWIDSIRQTTLGGLALGFGFLWTDLVCYAVGVATGAAAEFCSVQLHRRNRDSLSR